MGIKEPESDEEEFQDSEIETLEENFYREKTQMLESYYNGEIPITQELLKKFSPTNLRFLWYLNINSYNKILEGLMYALFPFSNKEAFLKIFMVFNSVKCFHCGKPDSDFLIFYTRNLRINYYGICFDCFNARIESLKKEIFPFISLWLKKYKANIPHWLRPKKELDTFEDSLDFMKRQNHYFELECNILTQVGTGFSYSGYAQSESELKQKFSEYLTKYKEQIDRAIIRIEIEKEVREEIDHKRKRFKI